MQEVPYKPVSRKRFQLIKAGLKNTLRKSKVNFHENVNTDLFIEGVIMKYQDQNSSKTSRSEIRSRILQITRWYNQICLACLIFSFLQNWF